jgi:ferrous iron transport protein B
VVDATQLHRQLYLTSQLLELGLPLIVVLTKLDRQEATVIDVEALSGALDCPVVCLDNKQNNARILIEGALEAILHGALDKTALTAPKPLQLPLESRVDCLIKQQQTSPLALEQAASLANASDEAKQDAISIMQARYGFINPLIRTLARQNALSTLTDPQPNTPSEAVQNLAFNALPKNRTSSLDTLDNWILHPILGGPIFLLMMYLLFMFAINVGSAFIDFFDILAGSIFVEYPLLLLAPFDISPWILTPLVGIGKGIQTVATFVPVIVCLFIGLSLLEASGYLARAAFVVDKLMQKMGLPGKAFVPLIVGFGCTVPAVMATRVLDKERERIMTIMMSPFMSCGARLPVYALFAAAFFPDNGQNLVFLLYLIGILAAVLTGLLLKATLLPGHSSLNFLELPLYEVPKLKPLFRRVWQRTRSFIMGAGKTIVTVVCVLHFFNALGTDGKFGHQDSDSSILSQGARLITPALAPMGIKPENWQAGVGIITGIFAKEALVATFNSLYSDPEENTDQTFSWQANWDAASDSVLANLFGISPRDPLGIDVGNISSLADAALEQEVSVTTYQAMQNAFAGKLGAFSYLLFILLYTPCAAAMGAIKNEVGTRWAGFAGVWSFALAYMSATACYQIGNVLVDPRSSSLSLAIIILTLMALYFGLKHLGHKRALIPTTQVP